MAKSSGDRYESAIAFARALQKVQIELSHSVTPIDILDDGVAEDMVEDEDEGLTRVRGVVSIDPQTAPAAGRTRQSAVMPPAASVSATPPVYEAADEQTMLRGSIPSAAATETRVRGPVEVPTGADATMLRAPASVSPEVAAVAPVPHGAEPAPKPARRGLWIGLGAAALVVVVAVIVGVSLPGILSGASTAPTPEATSDPQDPVSAIVPEPEDLAGAAVADGVRFAWTNPDPQEGDRYLVGVVTRAGEEPEFEPITETEVTVPADASGTTCVEVLLVRQNGQSSDPVRGCAP
jgi:hypothetical protein